MESYVLPMVIVSLVPSGLGSTCVQDSTLVVTPSLVTFSYVYVDVLCSDSPVMANVEAIVYRSNCATEKFSGTIFLLPVIVNSFCSMQFAISQHEPFVCRRFCSYNKACTLVNFSNCIILLVLILERFIIPLQKNSFLHLLFHYEKILIMLWNLFSVQNRSIGLHKTYYKHSPKISKNSSIKESRLLSNSLYS